MKYIRTKDGRIVDTTKYPEHPASWSVQASDYALTISQADTIEELCDQIVYNGYLYQNTITFDNCIVEDSFEALEEPINDEMIKSGIYGAIWTDKGLIYVAKMNENGEFELI